MQPTPTLQELNESLLSEIRRAMSLPDTEGSLAAVGWIFRKATLKVSNLFLGLDREVNQNGSAAGARWLLPHFVAEHEACGVELIPNDGPLLIVSNHPASYDGMLISGYIDRPDFKIIIGEIPPYSYLPHVSRHAIFSSPVSNVQGRMQTVRSSVRHLKEGGSLLIFPRGGIEPDPAFMVDPDAEFHKWSRSIEIFLQRVPETQVLVTAVSGVIAPSAMKHPITWFRKARPDRQRLAFMYQILCQILSGRELFGLHARVTFGEVLSTAEHQCSLSRIQQSARRTMQRHLSFLGKR